MADEVLRQFARRFTTFVRASDTPARLAVEGRERSVQCSIGIAEYPRDAENGIALLSVALRAADRAQNEGGGRTWSAADPTPGL